MRQDSETVHAQVDVPVNGNIKVAEALIIAGQSEPSAKKSKSKPQETVVEKILEADDEQAYVPIGDERDEEIEADASGADGQDEDDSTEQFTIRRSKINEAESIEDTTSKVDPRADYFRQEHDQRRPA